MNRIQLGRFVLLIVLLAWFFPLQSAVVHGPILNPSNGHMYYLLSRNNWTGSEQEAISLGGHLATVRNSGEQGWIFRAFGQGFGGGRLLWIGLNDAATEGVFTWSSGEPASFRFWAPNEPNNSSNGEDHVALYYQGHDAAGRWNDWRNINTDPIGIPLMGVAEVFPENFTPQLRDPVLVDFEGLPSMPFDPQPVPTGVRLFNQIQLALGVSFASSNGPVAVVNLGSGHAVSGTNGIGGIRNGSLNYSAPLSFAFSLPGFPDVPATTDFVSLRLDQLGGGPAVSLTAYGLNGEVLASRIFSDIGGRVVTVSGAGIHRVEFGGNGTTALDDLLFNGLRALPELSVRRKGNERHLAWHAAFADYVLESTTNLIPPIVWTKTETLPLSEGAEITAPVSGIVTKQFFRLRRE
jgi:hypothetical protein